MSREIKMRIHINVDVECVESEEDDVENSTKDELDDIETKIVTTTYRTSSQQLGKLYQQEREFLNLYDEYRNLENNVFKQEPDDNYFNQNSEGHLVSHKLKKSQSLTNYHCFKDLLKRLSVSKIAVPEINQCDWIDKEMQHLIKGDDTKKKLEIILNDGYKSECIVDLNQNFYHFDHALKALLSINPTSFIFLTDYSNNENKKCVTKVVPKRLFLSNYPNDLKEKLNNLKIARDIWSALGHKHLGKLLECRLYRDTIVYITEYARCGTLDYFVNKSQKLTDSNIRNVTLYYTVQILMALAYLHKFKLVHSNLTLECIFINYDGNLKIFGYESVSTEKNGENYYGHFGDLKATGKILAQILSQVERQDMDLETNQVMQDCNSGSMKAEEILDKHNSLKVIYQKYLLHKNIDLEYEFRISFHELAQQNWNDKRQTLLNKKKTIDQIMPSSNFFTISDAENQYFLDYFA